MSWHENTILLFYESDMILQVHSDVSYLTAIKSRSRAGGHFFFGPIPISGEPIQLNGSIHALVKILKFVTSSAAEAKLISFFLNAK